ncbi:hypothetical protein PRUPE_4G249100 [Prunus persica]|uniref:Uncharacterized protein n=1 Tax=Prunus persica TaxID=3760 RepID=A0A251PQH8_PRUPE|nr:hypothetical protein PRUPE_4G249100 [Prunus persica]
MEGTSSRIVKPSSFCKAGLEDQHTADAGVDCYDACNTGCVQSNTRLYQRCDRKCKIRCGPDSEVEGNLQ